MNLLGFGMQAMLASDDESEVFDRIGHIKFAAHEAGCDQGLVEQFAGWPHEGPASQVFFGAGLFANDEDARILRAFAEHGLGSAGA